MSEALAREYVDKITASAGFQNSERLCRFLRFIVEAKLRGEQDQIKEYVIGKEVFDRDGDYDPRLDPIVRVEARRLRKKLEEYYAGPGAEDAVRIGFPKGSYVPEIQEAAHQQTDAVIEAPPATPRPSGNRWWIPVVMLLVIAGLTWLLRPAAPSESINVIPARWIWPDEGFPEIRHDEDLAERIAAHLAKTRRVTSWPALQQFRNKAAVKLDQIARETGATRMVVVAVRVESDGFRVTAYLIDPLQGGRKLNVTDQRGVRLESPAERERFAQRLAAGLVLSK